MISVHRLLRSSPVQLRKTKRCFLATSVFNETKSTAAVHGSNCFRPLTNTVRQSSLGKTAPCTEKLGYMQIMNMTVASKGINVFVEQRRLFQTNANQTISNNEESYVFQKHSPTPKRNTIWEKHYEELKKFHNENGHCNIPATDGNRELYGWVHRQRKAYKNKERRLSQEQIEKLKDLKFSFDAQEETWMDSYNELLQYRANHGDCIVPLNNEPSMKGLSRWVDAQRQHYSRRSRGLKSSLTDERIAMLEKIEFAWNVLDVRWQQAFDELAEHVRINGSGVLPAPKSKLGYWLAKQRRLHRRLLDGETVSLTKERLDKLRSLGFL